MSKRLLLSGLLVIVAFAVFANSLHNGFVFDDLDIVVGDARIHDLSNLKALLADAYRPLRTISYAIDYAVWGLNPLGFRLTNIAIHAANCVLAFALARKLTGGALAASFVGALVFAVHPVQVESVAYVSGRRDVLFALFYLLAFLAYMRFREASTMRDRGVWLAATGVAFLLSLMSKEMAASFPLACLTWDFYRATEPDEAGARPSASFVVRRLVREGAAVYGAGLVAIAAFAWYTIYVRRATPRILGTDIEFWGGGPLDNALTVPLTYSHYAKLTVWPVTLAAQYYGAFDPASGFSDPRVVPAIVLIAALVAASIYLMARSRHRLAGFGVAWFLVTLMPASQVLPHHEIVADHYLYLPLVGVGLAVAAGLVALEPWRRVAYAVAAVVLVLLAARTVVRNRDFRDEATLWEATYAAVPASPRAAYNYGLVLTNRGDHQRAIPLYRQAIEADPTFVKAYFNLASTYASQRRVDDARAVYRAALASDLDAAGRTWHMSPAVLRATYQTELAMLDAQAGETAGARDTLAGILTQFPDLLRAEEFFATIVQQRGELAVTIDVYRARADASPASAPDRLVLANLLWKAGRLDEAYQSLARAAELRPDSCFANLYLARYYRDVRPGAAPAPGAVADCFERAVRGALNSFDADAVRRARGDTAAGPLAG